ncbi:MAG: MG2 domain-containing protein [Thermoanaerobaculales bacterium]|jgi:uncharacterized protein YfaS (alpha-2-macroglobulin family)|nr:MG2 domain-containing protein [Thermoanaerobaculales bacterium]
MHHHHATRRAARIIIAAVLLTAALLVGQRLLAGPGDNGGPVPPEGVVATEGEVSWDEVQRLQNEQKYEAAFEAVGRIRARAETVGDAGEQTRAIVEQVKLRSALHGYETAVRFLKETPWPKDEVSRAVLQLYYAHSLATYVHAYSWEIRQRERIETAGELDLKKWDVDQIVEASNAAFAEVWSRRESWGAESLGELSRYIEQNSYPPRIRGTLRDAVTYLWVELLADTALWRPDQENETFRLDFDTLLEGDPTASGGLDLGSAEVHPLEKIGALLDDLESWHRRAGRPEAAHEARLERLRRLNDAFDNRHDREAIRRHLEAVQTGFDPSLEWWSMGQSLLAELIQAEDAPDALIRAHAAAVAGRDRHPSSIGGQRCAHTVSEIEAPSYSLAAMQADGADRRSVQITSKNLERLHLRAYPYDLVGRILASEDYNLLPGHREIPEIMAAGTPAAEWSVELPPTPDFRNHVSYTTPPLPGPGAYLVVASARRDFADSANQLQALNHLRTDLVLVSERADDGYDVTARSGPTGEALEGVLVELYRFDWRGGHRRIATRRTGPGGRVHFSQGGWNHERHFLLASTGEDLAFDLRGLHRWDEPTRPEHTSTLVYTDRSVYRPQQELHFKVVAYSGGGESSRYRTLPDTEIAVRLFDANSDLVEETTLTTNGFGSASATFAIPAGRLLGRWRLETSYGGTAPIRVEEYKRPTFEVAIDDPAEALRLNRPAALRGSVRYYFGLPVVSGEVAWRVTREPVWPRWWSWWYPSPVTESQLVASGSGGLDEQGSFEVSFTPAADEREAADGVTYRYRLSVDVTDEGGETRSAERAFRLGFVAVEATVSSDLGYLSEHIPSTLRVVRSDLDGAPRAGAAAWRLLALAQPAEAPMPADLVRPIRPEDQTFASPGDALPPRWETSYDPRAVLATWEEGREAAAGTLRHGEDGAAEIDLPGLAPGAYRLVYTTKDDFGAEYTTDEQLVVVGRQRTPVRLPMLLAFERGSVEVGGTARLLVHTGLTAQQMVLEIHRDGRRVERREIAPGRSGVVELPITNADRGGFGVTLKLVRDFQLVERSAALIVPWTDRELEVGFATFRDRLRPGTAETFRVTVRGHDEALVDAASAELLATMYDRSLDIFAPYTPPSVASLYPIRTGVSSAWASLGVAHPVWQAGYGLGSLPGYPGLHGDRLKTISGYGVGGPGVRGRVYAAKMSMAEGLEMDAARQAAPAPASTDEAVLADMPMESLGENEEAKLEMTGPSAGDGEVELRSDFSETAFFEPHLLLEPDGSAVIEFEVPDSVTEWNVWVHALTNDLRGGSAHRTTRSVKELMVRPYLPRFLREGDTAAIKVVVNNAGETPLSGVLDFEISDPETGEDLRPLFGLSAGASTGVPFTVEPGAGANLSFPVTAPPRIGTVAFKVTARAGDFSDGELRPLPVLPGRMHLAQSRFVTLRDADRRELHFADMAAGDDPSLIHDQLVVTVDAQLFYSVLNALPYLVNYPYECTEQTLNRFLSTGIVSSVFEEYPAVASMAAKLAVRDTRLETWDAADPNRRMALEETPWLATSRGSDEDVDDLVKVLDPRIARAERDAALAKLEKAQTSLGAFPWWPGGPPSPYMTLYILYGFSKGLEFGVDVPKDAVVRAWAYLHRHYVDELVHMMMGLDCCWEFITYLNFVLSSYPDESWTGGVFTDDERRTMLDFSFRHWREHSPLLKGYLALTLERAGRHDDAVLVFDAVMDTAKSERDLGTYWAPEDRAWLWYNDTIETHAFALRVLSELDPADERRHGLVQWLLLNKKLNHWSSTRSTAEVISSLVHYLEHEDGLGVRENATVTVGPRVTEMVFEPDTYTGARNRVVVPGPEIDPETMSTVVVEKSSKGFAFASATWHFSTEKLPEEARGDLFAVTRQYFRRFNDGARWVLRPLADGETVAAGDQVEVHLSISAKHAAEYVHLRDPRGAGFEPETLHSQYKWDLGIGWYEEVRDSGANFFFEWLPAGEYTFSYRLRANMAGSFKVGPATLQSMYAPEFTAYSAGHRLEVAEE